MSIPSAASRTRGAARGRQVLPRPWWLASAGTGLALTGLSLLTVSGEFGVPWFATETPAWWAMTAIMHTPLVLILLFQAGGVIERLGYFWRGRSPESAGRLPQLHPTVCVQLPMFNEHAVARRVIEAAASVSWPVDRITIQVLDDSTDADTRWLVEDVCAQVGASTGVNCIVRHRPIRQGYKAGALEAGRRATDAEFIAIFDADFVPPRDFLLRAIPHFYRSNGQPDEGLALVQTQWGHLNDDESSLTRAQSLWVDDHHTLQMSWRSAMWRFVNFTGTAGVWRASAIQRVGGWRAESLVEDCELSFRHLFAGYRTKFVKEIVVPAELPATYTAYKAQQRRWTKGWVQLQRLHLRTLLFDFQTSWLKRLHLVYHMGMSWQWPAWVVWAMTLPPLIFAGHWFGAGSLAVGVVVYLLPGLLSVGLSATAASLETKRSSAGRLTPATLWRRLGRVMPYLVLNAGMLPHQFSAFVEGLFGGLNGEFERTPKAASVTAPTDANPSAVAHPRAYAVKIHWPYVLAEAFFVAYQLAWATVFAANGLVWCAIGAAFMAVCVLFVAFFYGDHAGKVCFVLDRSRIGGRGDRMPAVGEAGS